jgi:hypothetical protein
MRIAAALAGMLSMAAFVNARTGAGNRISDERTIDRVKMESLQRWVSAGHAGWCKDARLVAAEELWRVAPDYSGDGFEITDSSAETGLNDGNRLTFEWTPLDGRAVYRVTVERFEWLLPIAKNAESLVWVPTRTEIVTPD